MQSCTLIVLAAVVALALAEGQFYVPRAYYIIDSEGHESPPVPLRRLRRSLGANQQYPGYGGKSSANANANANANAWGDATANANANANAVAGAEELGNQPWYRPGSLNLGASNPVYKRH